MGAPRQDRTRSTNLRFILLALVTFSVVAGLYGIESRRVAALARVHRTSESRDLDARFDREADRLDARLRELETQAVRSLVPPADRSRLPAGVISASVWAKSSAGFTRVIGFEAEGVWEQALYRVLPAELAKRNTRVVLPIAGPDLANDPSAETLRLAIFPEDGGARTAVIAFRPSVLFRAVSAADGMKRTLIDEGGLVLAHTNASEIGMRTSALADLYRREAAASPDPEKAHRLASKSWEGYPSTIRFARLPGWNAFFAMEKVHAPVKAAANPIVLLISIGGGLLGVLFVGLAWIRPRERRAPSGGAVAASVPGVAASESGIAPAPGEIQGPRRGLRELRANPPPFVPRPSAITLSSGPVAPPPSRDLPTELGKFLAARDAKSETVIQNRLRKEKILLEEFEAEARRARDVSRLERKLVESVSGATKSPVLFFRYDPIQGIARLAAEAGYPASQSILDAGGMSFALETALVTAIHAEFARGRQKNLWEYAPLSRIMLSRLGIANFEAWPMAEARNPNLGPSRLLGVLVVAESGVDSVLHREFLGAILERASRHYARQNAGSTVI